MAVFFLIMSGVINAQEKHTISGYITENGSRENLLGVSIYVPELKLGTTTNDYGFFSLTLPQDKYEVYISYIGCHPNHSN